MKVTFKWMMPAILAAFFLAACGQQSETATPVEDAMDSATEAVEEAAGDAAEAVEEAAEAVEEAASNEPGGYVPTEDELIPGETRP
jgi:outer membrane lipoprotein-sorting protein